MKLQKKYYREAGLLVIFLFKVSPFTLAQLTNPPIPKGSTLSISQDTLYSLQMNPALGWVYAYVISDSGFVRAGQQRLEPDQFAGEMQKASLRPFCIPAFGEGPFHYENVDALLPISPDHILMDKKARYQDGIAYVTEDTTTPFFTFNYVKGNAWYKIRGEEALVIQLDEEFFLYDGHLIIAEFYSMPIRGEELYILINFVPEHLVLNTVKETWIPDKKD